jgi:hypothetical protein
MEADKKINTIPETRELILPDLFPLTCYILRVTSYELRVYRLVTKPCIGPTLGRATTHVPEMQWPRRQPGSGGGAASVAAARLLLCNWDKELSMVD